MNKPLKGFITYSHKNIEQKDELRERLAVMEQQNELVTWDDGQLTPGDEALQEDILEKVADSDLLIYLVSAASLASKNCNRELAEALKQEITVISIILEHCDWQHHQISCFEVLPHKGKPLTKWDDKSEGWQNVVEGIWKTIKKIKTRENPSVENTQNDQLAELVFQQGNFLLMLDQINKAIEVYSQVIKLNPRHVEAYNNRGDAYEEKGESDKAIKDFTKAIELNPNYAEAYSNRSTSYKSKGEYERAIEDCNIAIQLMPNLAEAYNNRGNAYEKKGDFDRAIQDFDIAIQLKPNYAGAYNNRGLAYDGKGEVDRAIQDFDIATQFNPNLVEAYSNRGNAYHRKGDFDRAIENYNKAIELNPDYAIAYNNRGFAHNSKGDFEQAIQEYKKAIQLDPNYTTAHANLNAALLNLQTRKKREQN